MLQHGEATFTTTTRVPKRVKEWLDHREITLAGAIRMIPTHFEEASKAREAVEMMDGLRRDLERKERRVLELENKLMFLKGTARP